MALKVGGYSAGHLGRILHVLQQDLVTGYYRYYVQPQFGNAEHF